MFFVFCFCFFIFIALYLGLVVGEKTSKCVIENVQILCSLYNVAYSSFRVI